MKRRSSLFLWLALLLGLVCFAPFPSADAQAPMITLRFATLAPRGSAWHRVFTAWGNTLRTQTQNRLTIEVVPATPGDEPALVRRVRAGELDGACFTAIGLGQIARPVLVLQAPGVFDGYAGLDRARTRLDGELRGLFEQNGTVLMGWSDYGLARIFSTHAVARPSDLRTAHPWVPADDPMFGEFLRLVGATGVPLGIGEVMAGLNAGRIDTVVASATAASALQWHTRLTHVMQQSSAVLLGGTLMSKARFDALPPDLQQTLRATGLQAHEALQRTVRRDDERYYETLTTRHGLTPVDLTPHAAEWRQMAEQSRERLVGRVFPRDLLDRALAASR